MKQSKHWSVDEAELKKDKNAYAIWRLEQAVNFGLRFDETHRKGKINKKELLKYWKKLDLDPAKKKFLSILLLK